MELKTDDNNIAGFQCTAEELTFLSKLRRNNTEAAGISALTLLEILAELKTLNESFTAIKDSLLGARQLRAEIAADNAAYQEILYAESDKASLIYQIEKKTIDWNFQRKYFGFPTVMKARAFVEAHLRADGLIP